MNLASHRLFLWVVTLLFLLCVPKAMHAAALYIDPPFSSLNRGDAASLAVRIDVDEEAGECINAADVIITYPENIEPEDVSRGQSIMSLWVEEPTINRQERTITFAGGIPGGYCGRVPGDPRLTNTLVTLIFRSPGFVIDQGESNDEAQIAFAPETSLWLHDGRGTIIKPDTYPATFNLNRQASTQISDPWNDMVDADNIPPEEFSIALQKDDEAFSQRYFIVFNTTDKQTGIDEYQVMEEPLSQMSSFNWGRADAGWITTRSPYVLQDQSLNSIIRVKAIDKAGNEYIATLIPEESLRTLSQNQITQYVLFAGVSLVVLLLTAIIIMLFRRRKKYRDAQDDEVEQERDEDEDDEELFAEDETDEYEKRE